MEQVKLIEGRFASVEAKELLLNIIGSKIQFHTTKNFSTEICTGEPNENSLAKIGALRESRLKVIKLLEEAQADDLLVEIHSSISISCIPKEE